MNILSIDIDFLFMDMNLIQKNFDTDLTPSQSWQVVKWKTKKDKFNYDESSYNFLLEILSSKIKKDTKIFKIWEHDKIVPLLENEKVKNSTVFNIDYHHDISYDNDDTELTIENWVTHCKRKKILEKYNWITQFDAKPCVCSMLTHSRIDWENVDVEKLPEFDIIIVCVSKHFTPKEHWELADELIKYSKSFKKFLTLK